MLAKSLIIGRIATAPVFQPAAAKRTEARVLLTNTSSRAGSMQPPHVLLTTDVQQVRLLQHHGQTGRLWLAEGRLDYATIAGRDDRTAFIRCDFGAMAPLDDVSLAVAGRLPSSGRPAAEPNLSPGMMQVVTLVGRIAVAPEYRTSTAAGGEEVWFDLTTTRQYASRQSGDFITQNTTHRVVTSVISQIELLKQHGRRTRLFIVTGEIDYLPIPGRDERAAVIRCDASSIMRPLDDVALDLGTTEQTARQQQPLPIVAPDSSPNADHPPAPVPPQTQAPATTDPDDDTIWLA